ncbi:YciI family protein [Kribbella sp. CA-247076]|uniref:YciI family protein n=1 Tax=Kribbella sp. CA-247076 TaxID=3239941 RepID=UPI003D90265F
MKFDRYTVILLTLRDDAPVLDEAEAAALQDRHLAHGANMQERGLVLARGPLLDQDDERFRGFSVWSVDPETARQHAEADPAVQIGRLAVNVMTWMMPAGNLTFTKVHPPRSTSEATDD